MELALILSYSLTCQTPHQTGKEFLGDRVYISGGSVTPNLAQYLTHSGYFVTVHEMSKHGLNWIFAIVFFRNTALLQIFSSHFYLVKKELKTARGKKSLYYGRFHFDPPSSLYTPSPFFQGVKKHIRDFGFFSLLLVLLAKPWSEWWQQSTFTRFLLSTKPGPAALHAMWGL